MGLITLDLIYFMDPIIGQPVFNGSIYIGNPGTDPIIPENQKNITLKQENGDEIVVAQPVKTGAGGVPIYEGAPVQLIVAGEYSLKLLNNAGAQVYYIPSATSRSDPRVITSDTTMGVSDFCIIIDASSANVTLTLLAADNGASRNIKVQRARGDTSSNTAAIIPDGTDTIGGEATLVLLAGEGYELIPDGISDYLQF